MKQPDLSSIAGKNVQPLWKVVWLFLYQTQDPAIVLLGIYPRKMKSSCTRLLTAALLVIAKNRKQPQCATADKQLTKL